MDKEKVSALFDEKFREQLEAVHRGDPVIIQEAPAGTGKSRTLAIIAKYQDKLGIKTMIITAQTNEAINNIYSALQDVGVASQNILIARSAHAEYSRMDEEQGRLYQDVENTALTRLEEVIRDDPMRVNGEVYKAVEIHRKHPAVQLNATLINAAAFETMDMNKRILIGTTAMVRKTARKLKMVVDMIAVDEAGQTSSSEILAIMANLRAQVKRILVTGDSKQLHTMIPRRQESLEHYGLKSALQTLMEQEATVIQLKTSYRFHPELCNMISRAIYQGELEAGVNEISRGALVQRTGAPFHFIDVAGQERRNQKGSYSNTLQIATAMKVVEDLLQWNLRTAEGKPVEIAIISFYAWTAQEIRKGLNEMQRKTKNRAATRIEAKTVDAFQGHQKDIVIVVTTKTTRNKEREFALDDARTTVAITRAKQGLILIGDRSNLTAMEGPMKAMILESDKRGKK